MTKILLSIGAAALMCGCSAKRSVAVSDTMIERSMQVNTLQRDSLSLDLQQVIELDFDSLELCVVTDSTRRTVWLRARRAAARRSDSRHLQAGSSDKTESRDTVAVVAASYHERTVRPTASATATPWLLLAVATALGVILFRFCKYMF